MKSFIKIFVITLALGVFSCAKKVESSVTVVTAAEKQVILELDDVQVIDVRTPEEFNAGHIKNAQNMDFYSPTFDELIKTLDKEKPVILYCRSGVRSANSAEKMEAAGFKAIYDLKEGYSKWHNLEVAL